MCTSRKVARKVVRRSRKTRTVATTGTSVRLHVAIETRALASMRVARTPAGIRPLLSTSIGEVFIVTVGDIGGRRGRAQSGEFVSDAQVRGRENTLDDSPQARLSSSMRTLRDRCVGTGEHTIMSKWILTGRAVAAYLIPRDLATGLMMGKLWVTSSCHCWAITGRCENAAWASELATYSLVLLLTVLRSVGMRVITRLGSMASKRSWHVCMFGCSTHVSLSGRT